MPVSKKRKKKKKRKNNQNSLRKKSSNLAKERLLKKVTDSGITNIKQGKFKDSVSELLLDFGQDCMEMCETNEDYEKYVPFLIICWNIGNIQDENKREKEIKRVIQEFGTDKIEFEIRMLIRRKLEYYNEYRYAILNYEITYPNGEFYLMVASVKN